jgi:hypothetical protein
MLAQGLLDFQYEADSPSHGLTSLAGLPLYLDLIKACGLGGAIRTTGARFAREREGGIPLAGAPLQRPCGPVLGP